MKRQRPQCFPSQRQKNQRMLLKPQNKLIPQLNSHQMLVSSLLFQFQTLKLVKVTDYGQKSRESRTLLAQQELIWLVHFSHRVDIISVVATLSKPSSRLMRLKRWKEKEAEQTLLIKHVKIKSSILLLKTIKKKNKLIN